MAFGLAPAPEPTPDRTVHISTMHLDSISDIFRFLFWANLSFPKLLLTGARTHVNTRALSRYLSVCIARSRRYLATHLCDNYI